MKQPYLLLVDGSSVLSTMFFGNLPRELLFAKTEEDRKASYHKIMMTSEGTYTNALYGFFRFFLKLLKENTPSHICVAWDLTRETFRREMYAPYKAQRSETMKPLAEQFALCQDLLKQIGIPQLMSTNFEADDYCGTLARRFENEIPVALLTKDTDYLQLVSDKTLLLLMHTTKEKTDELYQKYKGKVDPADYPDRVFPLDPERVFEEYGIHPSEVPSLKGLMGDTSDNIPGVKGVGEKTAVSLIQKYHSLSALYEAMEAALPEHEKELKEEWKEIGIRRSPIKALTDEKENAFLSEKLARIVTDIPMETKLSDYELHPDLHALSEIFDELEFASLRGELMSLIGGGEEETGTSSRGSLQRVTMEEALQRIASCERETLPLEITGEGGDAEELLFRMDGKPFVASLTDGEALYHALREYQKKGNRILTLSGKKLYRLCKEEADIREGALAEDLLLMAYCMNPLQAPKNHEELRAMLRLSYAEEKKKLLGKDTLTGALRKNTEGGREYAEMLLLTIEEAWPLLCSSQEFDGKTEELYRSIELPLQICLANMERRGIGADKEALQAYGKMLEEGIREKEEAIFSIAGERFNIQSTAQLGEILFEKLSLPSGKKTKTGYSTAADVLENLAEDYPIASLVLEYRTLTKLRSTYAKGLQAFIGEDGRIHGVFHQNVTATGRISSSDPNLQNIPVRMALGREIRKVFVAGEGKCFVDSDYSQIELRVLAHMSGDTKLIQAYRKALDIHAITASEVFHVPLDEVTPELRRKAKAVNFGIVYGISSFGLSEGLHIPKWEAKETIDRYFETYPKVKEFLDGLVSSAMDKGYSETLYGRRRPIPELHSRNFAQRSFGERVAMNAPIQGTAADLMKIAMIRTEKRLKDEGVEARIVLQVHDELLLELPVGEKDRVSAMLQEEMQGVADLLVPLETEVHSGKNWFEAK